MHGKAAITIILENYNVLRNDTVYTLFHNTKPEHEEKQPRKKELLPMPASPVSPL